MMVQANGIFAARRKNLGSEAQLWIFAGASQSRNYPANHFAYRASSHFLYTIGEAIEDAIVCIDGETSTLFSHAPDAADALWHGPRTPLSELQARLGLEVRPLTEAKAFCDRKRALTLPVMKARKGFSPKDILGREFDEALDRNAAKTMVAARSQHDEHAIAQLRLAAEATIVAHKSGLKATAEATYEHHIMGAMVGPLANENMTTAYPPIVTTHGHILHNNDYQHKIDEGSLLLADVGAETVSGWAGDVTRTWPTNGKYSDAQREIYEIALLAQKKAIDAVKIGAEYRDIHLLAAKVIAEGLVDVGLLRGDPDELVDIGAHAFFFPHGLGHIIGLDVHDMEDLGDVAGYAEGRSRAAQFGLCYLRLDRPLLENMAITIEPGIYFVPAIRLDESILPEARSCVDWEKYAEYEKSVRGIRIEDDILVTSSGAEVLTGGAPKEIADIEAALDA